MKLKPGNKGQGKLINMVIIKVKSDWMK